MPLSESVPETLRATRGFVVYGSTMPERQAYDAAGYGHFCTRADLVAHIAEAAEAAHRPPSLGFINTIEHNERNYHTPWRGR